MTGFRRRTCLAAVATVAAVTSGCQSGGGGSPSVSATTAPTTTVTAGSVCSALVLSGQALVTTVTQFAGGQATGDQVRAAASLLSASIDAARATIGTQANARLDDAKAALQRLEQAVTAQPPDVAGARQAASDALAALRDAATLCQSGSPAPTA
jgi:hypothetical protein